MEPHLHESETERQPGPFELYEELTGVPALAAYEQRLTIEQAVFNYAEEIQRLREAEATYEQRLQSIVTSTSLSDSERISQYEDAKTSLHDILNGEQELKTRKHFYTMREVRWNRHHQLGFSSEEPESMELLAAIRKAQGPNEKFIQAEDLRADIDRAKPAMYIEGLSGPFDLPAKLVVSAESFESWQTGRGEVITKNDAFTRSPLRMACRSGSPA